MGNTRAENGDMQAVTTFVIVVEPRTAVSLGRVEVSPHSADCYALKMERLLEPRDPRGPLRLLGVSEGKASLTSFGFPLPGASGPYLCTQGVGGHLTHFFPESYYAIDLRCNPGTPVLSIGDGVVKEVAESHQCSGIHAANLAAWNAVSVHLDCGLIVEYLHTAPGSSRFKVGDTVLKGEVLCESGDIGFAPEPHLHVELHEASDAEGPSVPLCFRGRSTFIPVAGRWYMPEGEVPAPENATSVSSVDDHETTQSSSRLRSLMPFGGATPPPPRPNSSWSNPQQSHRRLLRCGCIGLKRKLSRRV